MTSSPDSHCASGVFLQESAPIVGPKSAPVGDRVAPFRRGEFVRCWAAITRAALFGSGRGSIPLPRTLRRHSVATARHRDEIVYPVRCGEGISKVWKVFALGSDPGR